VTRYGGGRAGSWRHGEVTRAQDCSVLRGEVSSDGSDIDLRLRNPGFQFRRSLRPRQDSFLRTHSDVANIARSRIRGLPNVGMMLGKRKAVSMVPPPKKKRKSAPAIEEIKFDINAREDYLTGFHKRKLHRAKHAREEAAKRDREAKIEARKIVRLF
jgi:hypothetical protein